MPGPDSLRWPARSDAVLAVVLAAAALGELAASGSWSAVPAASVMGMTVPLAWRRRSPLIALCVTMVAFAVQEMFSGVLSELIVPFVVLVVAVFSMAAYQSFDRAIAGGVVAIGAVSISIVRDEQGADLEGFVYAMVVIGLSWTVGRAVWRRTDRIDILETAGRRLAEEQAANTALAVAQERSRIAREMHDIIAHSMSVMILQATAATEVLDENPGEARSAMQRVQEVGREALGETRRLLGLLREGEDEAGTAPLPRLNDVVALSRRLQETGLDVRFSAEGDLSRVGDALGVCVYRVVQEATTNILKHARAKTVTISVRAGTTDLEVEIADDGVGLGRGTGFGLSGIRERVDLFGGSLDVTNGSAGGTVVRAVLPVHAP